MDISGEVDYRRYAGTPSPKPKYLSDSLTPWYGAWRVGGVSTLSIDYTNLPIGSAVAKIVGDIVAGEVLVFDFGGVVAPPIGLQNFSSNKNIVEFYYKCSVNNPRVVLFMLRTRWGFPDPAGYFTIELNIAGAAPTVWTYKSFQIPTGFSTFVPGTTTGRSREEVISQIKEFAWNLPAFAAQIQVSGFTIRRL